MSKENLTKAIDPFQFASNATQLHESIPLAEMGRLKESLVDAAGEVSINVKFGIDMQGIKYLKANYACDAKLQCQRCMETFSYPVMGEFTSALVTSDKVATQLPKHYEPLIVNEGALVVSQVIEDELILSLPIVPMHDSQTCHIKLPYAAAGPKEEEKPNPFKAIEALKKQDLN